MPEVVFAEAARLGRDLREHVRPADDHVRGALREIPVPHRVFLVGDGDSHHAGIAAELAFESLARVPCEPMSALQFLEYGCAGIALDGPPDGVLVVLVSASGETERVVCCAERARAAGARTLAVTGDANATLARVADAAVVLRLADKVPAPGIRTYQASLLALLLTAVRLGGSSGARTPEEADAHVTELAGLADHVDATEQRLREPCRDLAEAVAPAPVMSVVGGGPSRGTALYAAAKVVETAGLFAAGQDTEEWCHVERFAGPRDIPVVVVAPPGRAHWRAVSMAAQAAALGRQVVAVVDEHDEEVARHAGPVLRVRGSVREEFSPLLYHLFAAPLAGHLALRLGRTPFAAGRV